MKKDIRNLYNFQGIDKRNIQSGILESSELYNLFNIQYSGKSIISFKKYIDNTTEYSFSFQSLKTSPGEIFTMLGKKQENILNLLEFEEFEIIQSHNEKKEYSLRVYDKGMNAYLIRDSNLILEDIYFPYTHKEVGDLIRLVLKTPFPYTKEILHSIFYWVKYQNSNGYIFYGMNKAYQKMYFNNISFDGFIEFIKKYNWESFFSDFLYDNQELLFNFSIEYIFEGIEIEIISTELYIKL